MTKKMHILLELSPKREHRLVLFLVAIVAVMARVGARPQKRLDSVALSVDNARNTSTKAPCAPLSAEELKRVLGGAYNRRFMSWNPSGAAQDSRPGRGGEKGEKGGEGAEDFSVDPSYARTLGGRAAWLVDNMEDAEDAEDAAGLRQDLSEGTSPSDGEGRSRRRQRAFDPTPWSCKWRIRWTYLGPDYFPPYLRSVECEQRRCWYDKYECRPRAFAIKLLRRIPDQCAEGPPPPHLNSEQHVQSQKNRQPTELWMWEERAVAFCCECALVD